MHTPSGLRWLPTGVARANPDVTSSNQGGQPTIIHTTAGPVRGRIVNEVLQLRGVPFAEPPIGALADQPPQPPTPWSEPRDARKAGPAPLQPQLFGMGMRSSARCSEDCLTLNVDAPAKASSAPAGYPVMVWIFGGGYITGDAADPLFDGANLASEGVIVVRANYRLGALGRNNLGLRDQVRALQWLQENAKAFGGDPNRVTLFGESAGAMSICNLLTLPTARGLFHGAIAQSGAGSNIADTEQATEADRRWQGARAKLQDPSDGEQLMELQSRLGRELRPKFGGMPFRPVVDGDLMPAHPEHAAGQGADIPLIIGHNADEHRLYMNPRHRFKDGGLIEELSRRLPIEIIDELPDVYPELSDLEQLAAVETELRYRQPQQRYVRAREHARAGEHAAPNTWTYRFNWPSPALRGWLGACHAIEIPFVFNNFTQRTTAKFVGPGHEALAKEVLNLWVHFAKNGRPPDHWLPYPQVLEIHPHTRTRPTNAIEAFWNDAMGTA